MRAEQGCVCTLDAQHRESDRGPEAVAHRGLPSFFARLATTRPTSTNADRVLWVCSTDNAVKNHWNSTLKRKYLSGNYPRCVPSHWETCGEDDVCFQPRSEYRHRFRPQPP
eukprot:1193917-Prorocentrum_minimum.AAC.1